MAKYDPKGLVTNEYLDDAADKILKGMNTMINNFRVEVKGAFNQVGKRFDRVETRLNKIEVELAGVKDEVQGLKADLSDTVSKREFNTFKLKMDRFATS